MSILVKKRHLVTKRQPGYVVAEECGIFSLHNAPNWNVIHKHIKEIFNGMNWALKQVGYHTEKKVLQVIKR